MRQGFTTAKLLGVPSIIPTKLNKFASHCTESLGSKIPVRPITYLQPAYCITRVRYTVPDKECHGGIVREKAKKFPSRYLSLEY